MSPKLVLLRETPSLDNIPALFRKMADDIESGEVPNVECALVVLPVDGDYPRVYGWGNVDAENDPRIQFDLAKLWLLNTLVRRS